MSKKQKKQRRKLNIPRLVMVGTGLILLLAVGILGLVLLTSKNDLVDQNIASRWSGDKDFAHNSIFFSTREAVDNKVIEHLRVEIKKGFTGKSIEASFEDEGENKQNLMDAYAAFGVLSLSSEIRKEKNYDAIGVGGDFFKFHPVQLVSGNYFDDDNIMSDYILLDEEAAWEMFGGSNVTGMHVQLNGKDLYIAGVYKRKQSEIDNLAQGNTEPKVFVSYEVMKEANKDAAITVYELLGPNPIPHAAYNVVKDVKLFNSDNVKYVENSNRFSYAHYYKLLKERKGREMRTDDIGYPYWENVARYKEGRLMYVAFWQWNIAGIMALMIIVNVIWFIVDHKPDKKTFEKLVDSVREKHRKKRYEEQRQKLIEEEFGPEPIVEDEPIKEVEQIGENPADTEFLPNESMDGNSENGTDPTEAAVVDATMKMIAEGENNAANPGNVNNAVESEEIPEDSVDLRLKEVKTEAPETTETDTTELTEKTETETTEITETKDTDTKETE